MRKAIQLFFLSVLFLTVIGNAQNKVKGNGKLTTDTRTTAEYEAVEISGFYDVVLVSGKEGTITIKGEENILPHIKVEVVNNVLKIYTEKNKNLHTNKNIDITVPFEEINAVNLSGSGDISTKNPIVTPTFKAKLSGSGDLKLEIKSKEAEVGLSGSGDVILKGNADNFISKISGSGDINAIDLITKKADVSISGSGDMKVYCTENLYARVSGSGDIEYKGNPENKDTKVSGSGEITKIP